MKKPQLLRQHLIKYIPKLAQNPEQLLIFVDDGKILTTSGHSLSFEYQYTLSLIVVEWLDSPTDLIIWILAWLHLYQPPNAIPTDDCLAFNAEYLGSGAYDISINIKLSERVKITTAASGFDIKYLSDEIPDDLAPEFALKLKQLIS